MDLEQRIDLMKTIYYKGFSGSLNAIRDACDEWYLSQDRSDEHKEFVLSILSRLEAHYETIPFEQLDQIPDFAPIYVVRELLHDFGDLVRPFFDDPTEETYHRIKGLHMAIEIVGNIYQANFERRIAELRSIPGHEKDRVEVVDYRGATFYF